MKKIIDITDKMSFEEPPVIRIKGVDITVSNRATTLLHITAASKLEDELEILKIAKNELFSKKDYEKIEKMNLSFKDLMTVITCAISAISGSEEEESGEQ